MSGSTTTAGSADDEVTDGGVFDYVVVGAGSAGCAVAARLSDDSARRVLLLEAGPRDTRREIHMPATFSQLFRSEVDWDYSTAPQPSLAGRSVYWPRGKVLGGSSSINAMMWVRGFPQDYDRWAEAAGDAWSWDALRPYFLRVERVEGATGDDTGAIGAMCRRRVKTDPCASFEC